ncbi:hypothetical protein EDD85DRAFT_395858 [Armillaria nabsnona]|nr:hypothetical protein EDD85DRAFT_395858 [Armillaria nabsnona]
MALMAVKLGEMKPATQAVDQKCYIQTVEVCDLQTSIRNYPGIYLKVLGESVDYQTPVIQMASGSTPSWSVAVQLDDFGTSSSVKSEIYGDRGAFIRMKLLGHGEIQRSDLLYSTETMVPLLSNGPPAINVCSLRIYCSRDSREVAGERVKAIAKPKQHTNAIVTVLDSLEPLQVMVDMLAEAHPAAKIAFNIVSIGYNILKKQEEANQLVLDLYNTMLDTYRDATNHRMLLFH